MLHKICVFVIWLFKCMLYATVVPSVLIFLPPLYTILICHCSQLLYHPSIKLKGLQLVIVVASYTQHGLWSWVPTANQLSNPTRRSFVIKDRWMYHILQPHFRLIVADERWTLSQTFPLYSRGWAVDPPKKMTNCNEDTSSRGHISNSLICAKISDLPRRYFH